MSSYNRLNEYLKNLFGTRTLKICINGGFTCPNRDGTKGTSGCIFCLSGGTLIRENEIEPISKQVDNFLSSYKGLRSEAYIAYFQEYTNTYAPIDELKRKYDEALNSSDKFVALDVDTRADCINEEICQLLASYQDKYHVFVEIGMQTASDTTHALINQNITNDDIVNAVKLLKKYDLETIVHLMVDLPGENHKNVVESLKLINELDVDGIKIHNTYVLEGTKLGEMYKNHEYIPFSQDDYIDEVVYILTHLNPKIVIHRLVGDAPEDKLLGPSWAKNKKQIMNEINKIMDGGNLSQGMYYKA